MPDRSELACGKQARQRSQHRFPARLRLTRCSLLHQDCEPLPVVGSQPDRVRPSTTHESRELALLTHAQIALDPDAAVVDKRPADRPYVLPGDGTPAAPDGSRRWCHSTDSVSSWRSSL